MGVIAQDLVLPDLAQSQFDPSDEDRTLRVLKHQNANESPISDSFSVLFPHLASVDHQRPIKGREQVLGGTISGKIGKQFVLTRPAETEQVDGK